MTVADGGFVGCFAARRASLIGKVMAEACFRAHFLALRGAFTFLGSVISENTVVGKVTVGNRKADSGADVSIIADGVSTGDATWRACPDLLSFCRIQLLINDSIRINLKGIDLADTLSKVFDK